MHTPTEIHGDIRENSNFKNPAVGITHLKDRGWSQKMVDRFLGDPDVWKSNPHHLSGPKRRLWSASRVRGVEQGTDFLCEFQERITAHRATAVKLDSLKTRATAREWLNARM